MPGADTGAALAGGAGAPGAYRGSRSAADMTEPASVDDRAVPATVVACCQLAPVLGDPAANRELAVGAVAGVVERSARVVVLPELVSSGYVFESRAEARASAEAADGET